MTTDVKDLLGRALDLPEEERAALAGWLIESLEAEAENGLESAWRQEIERRVKELDSGSVEAVPWAVVKKRLAETGG
jgi:putative addiction module component (TIGR02574 family)